MTELRRFATLLSWVSIVVCLTGVGQLLGFERQAPWGKGGEVSGVALALGALQAIGILLICAIVGLTLALIGQRFLPPARTVKAALIL